MTTQKGRVSCEFSPISNRFAHFVTNTTADRICTAGSAVTDLTNLVYGVGKVGEIGVVTDGDVVGGVVVLGN